jgi:hypothetical protein
MSISLSLGRTTAAMVAAGAILVGAQSASFAAGKEKEIQAPAGAAGVMSASVAQVEGFRSARFGMSEAEVRAAAAKDFGAKSAEIKEQSNPGERTHVLLVKAPDVLPGGGIGEVSYVFGYNTKRLIQVSVSWSKATDDKMTPEQLYSNSSVLRAHFLSEGFKPESIASNMPINGGLLVFRGSDAKDRTAMLILQGTLASGKDNQRILTPTALTLFYVEDAKAPDIYRLPQGSF